MKNIFILLTIFYISPLNAQTLIQYYPPSLYQNISGKYTFFNSSMNDTFGNIREKTYSDNSGYTMFNIPIEVRHTVTEFPAGDLMIAGGLSLYYENWKFSSLNLSLGLTFGYGYNRNKQNFFNRLNFTLYPLYDFPLTVHWNKFKFPWKAALGLNWELIRIKFISINIYNRSIIFLTSEIDSGYFYRTDFGLTAGIVF